MFKRQQQKIASPLKRKCIIFINESTICKNNHHDRHKALCDENKIDLDDRNDMSNNGMKEKNAHAKKKINENASVGPENTKRRNANREYAEFKRNDTKIEANKKDRINSAHNSINELLSFLNSDREYALDRCSSMQ